MKKCLTFSQLAFLWHFWTVPSYWQKIFTSIEVKSSGITLIEVNHKVTSIKVKMAIFTSMEVILFIFTSIEVISLVFTSFEVIFHFLLRLK